MDEFIFMSFRSIFVLSVCLINHTTMSLCNGKLTANCNILTQVCDRELSWKATKNEIKFVMSAKTDKWLAVGISKDQLMPFTDTYVGWTARGATYLSDRYIGKYRIAPTLDKDQNLFVVNGSYINGHSSIEFQRPIVTNDANDISIDGCRYFFLAVGGTFNSVTKEIDKHISRPIVTPQAICINPSTC